MCVNHFHWVDFVPDLSLALQRIVFVPNPLTLAQIMIGVHGNGLSHQLWMKPNSGVLEVGWVAATTFPVDSACISFLIPT
jgi:hypothetical protein